MESIHGELPLASKSQTLRVTFQEKVVVPIHMITEIEVVETSGRNRPNTSGRTVGTGVCFENSLEVRSCNSSGLGRK